MPSGSRAVSAAPISEPSSMVPVVSTVTCTMIGTWMPDAVIARLAPRTADLVCSRSWQVSIITASMPPSSMPATCCVVGVPQRGVRRVAQRGQLGAGPDRAEHEAGLAGGAELVGLGAGQRGAGPGQLEDPVGDVVLGQVGQVGAEGVGLDRVDPDLEVGAVHRPDDVRPGHVEDLVAALEAGEVVQRRVLGLQHRAHRAVGHENALGERGQQGVLAGGWSLLQGNSSLLSGSPLTWTGVGASADAVLPVDVG